MRPSNGLRAVVLIVASTGAAVFANAIRPNRLAWVIDPKASMNPGVNKEIADRVSISLEELRRHLAEASATIIDARKPEEYSEGHLVGAINIPSTEKTQHLDRIFQIPREGLTIIYCGGRACEASDEVFEFLVGNGFKLENLRIFKPGWELLSTQADIQIARGME